MSKIFAFLAGAAIGAAVMNIYLSSKYVMITNSEWDEFARFDSEEAKKDILDGEHSKADDAPREKCLRRIRETEFGEESDYETGTLYRYLDGTITDSSNKPITPIDIPGIEEYACFGNNPKSIYIDELYLRDDKHKIDYEVLMVDEAFEKEEGAVGT